MADVVEKKTETATAQQGVEEVKSPAPVASEAKADGLDLADALEKTLEALSRTETDRDNYRDGLLAAKGKKSVAREDETDDEKIARIVSEQIAQTEQTKTNAQVIEQTKQVIRRNKELELALQNKGTAGTGSSQGTTTDTTAKPGDNMLSDTQVNSLKARGWDDAKIARFKANLSKAH